MVDVFSLWRQSSDKPASPAALRLIIVALLLMFVMKMGGGEEMHPGLLFSSSVTWVCLESCEAVSGDGSVVMWS